MRTIIWFLYFWLYLIVVLPEYWRVCRMEKRGETERHDRLVRKHVQNWAGRLLRLAGAEITTTGRENIPEGPVVFVANHQGFKAGAIRVATRAHVPVVPVCIDGSYKLMKKGSLWIHPAKVKIRILPAISTEGMSREEIRALPEKLREQIGNGIEQLRKEQPA